jgi:hypothetical protein
MWDERFAGRCNRRRGGDHEQHQPADRDERNRPQSADEQRGLALVDEVVLADGGRRLGQIGGVSPPALDLESPLVVGVEKDRKTQRYEAEADEDATNDTGVGEAMMPLIQDVPRSGHADVGDGQHVLDQMTPTIRYGLPRISATTIGSPIVT